MPEETSAGSTDRCGFKWHWFGNLSIRDGANFYITGSATGGIPELSLADCARVVAYDFKRNWLRYEGAAIPSSESLTHAAVYESDAKLEQFFIATTQNYGQRS